MSDIDGVLVPEIVFERSLPAIGRNRDFGWRKLGVRGGEFNSPSMEMLLVFSMFQ
jgi:hypothetical protein